MTVQYDPSTLNFLRTIFKWKGTAFPLVAHQFVFWCFFAWHVALPFIFRHVYRGDRNAPGAQPMVYDIPPSTTRSSIR